jgi:crotonobetainyl-CoA:carnitine CoA-transferase CaiB-like acyl-CoA transferase
MTMLDGIRIVDLSSVIFGPYATQMLADMGADVIKVEPPMGDISRYFGRSRATRGMGSTHMTVNRGKRSVMLDLKQPDDAEKLRKLLKTADIFIHNIRAKAIEKLGFSYESVRAIKPDIIYAHFTGFGQDGPYRDLQAYDDVIQAATGCTTLLPRADGNPKPRYIPSLIADKVAGQYGAQAMLGGIIHKLRTGEGQHIEVPMFEAFANFTLEEHLQDATMDPPLGPIGYPRQLDPNRQPFPTIDGHISIVPYTDDKFKILVGLLGEPDLVEREEFATPQGRFRNSAALYGHIARLTQAKTTAQWMEILTVAEFPAMPVRDLADVMDDPHFVETGFFRPREHPTEGRFFEMRPPIRFSADPDRKLGLAPMIGEHNQAIFDELSEQC